MQVNSLVGVSAAVVTTSLPVLPPLVVTVFEPAHCLGKASQAHALEQEGKYFE